jgi:hypothetical protein
MITGVFQPGQPVHPSWTSRDLVCNRAKDQRTKLCKPTRVGQVRQVGIVDLNICGRNDFRVDNVCPSIAGRLAGGAWDVALTTSESERRTAMNWKDGVFVSELPRDAG